MEIKVDAGLAYNMAKEEISKLINDLVIYKTINIQKDKTIIDLEDKIKKLETNNKITE